MKTPRACANEAGTEVRDIYDRVAQALDPGAGPALRGGRSEPAAHQAAARAPPGARRLPAAGTANRKRRRASPILSGASAGCGPGSGRCSSSREARLYRTTFGAEVANGPNFAGDYTLAAWGCGHDCTTAAIVAARNGRVFFPAQLRRIGTAQVGDLGRRPGAALSRPALLQRQPAACRGRRATRRATKEPAISNGPARALREISPRSAPGALCTTDERGWPELCAARDGPTIAALHLFSQVVGKVPTALLPWRNHGWHLDPSRHPARPGHRAAPRARRDVHARPSTWSTMTSSLRARQGRRSAAARADVGRRFPRRGHALLAEAGHRVHIHAAPNEIDPAIPFARGQGAARLRSGQRRAACTAPCSPADRVFRLFRSSFLGKASPVHFFWGSFDLAVTRFSGRAGAAPSRRHPQPARRGHPRGL